MAIKWNKTSSKMGREKQKGFKSYIYESSDKRIPKLRYESNASHPYSFEGGWGEFDSLKEAKKYAENEIVPYMNDMDEAEKNLDRESFISRGVGSTSTSNT